MTELTDLNDTDALNTAVTSQSTEGNTANMGGMDNLFQATLGMLSRFRNANIFRLRDNTDKTKLLAFDLSGLTTATTTTVSPPASGGLLATESYATTATAAGTTTLTAASAKNQYFTGTTTQTVVLPVTSTLVLGQQFRIVNNSTGLVTVQSSGANTIRVMGGTGVTFAPGAPGTELILTCISTTGTGTASWAYKYETPTTDWVAYTPTFTGFGTVSAVTMFSRRVGDTLQIRGSFAMGTPTDTQARMTLGFNGTNDNVTVNSTKVPTIQQAGTAVTTIDSTTSWYTLIGTGVGYITFSVQNLGNHGTAQANGTTVGSAGRTMFLLAEVPISGW